MRFCVWTMLFTEAALAVVCVFASKRTSATPPLGFLVSGQVRAHLSGEEAGTPAGRRCMVDSEEAGTIRQGIPVTIRLNGNAVGGGDLSSGKLEMYDSATATSWTPTFCVYKFSAPVIEPGNGLYTVQVGTESRTFSVNELHADIVIDVP
jgi:hypothetical protein